MHIIAHNCANDRIKRRHFLNIPPTIDGKRPYFGPYNKKYLARNLSQVCIENFGDDDHYILLFCLEWKIIDKTKHKSIHRTKWNNKREIGANNEAEKSMKWTKDKYVIIIIWELWSIVLFCSVFPVSHQMMDVTAAREEGGRQNSIEHFSSPAESDKTLQTPFETLHSLIITTKVWPYWNFLFDHVEFILYYGYEMINIDAIL